jgi:hypothetical protein
MYYRGMGIGTGGTIFAGSNDSGRTRVISRSRIRLLSSLVFLSAFLLQGCAISADARTERMDQRFEAGAAVLEHRADADSLAAAALLRSAQTKPEPAINLMTRAVAAAPQRADLAWLTIQLCQRVSTCHSEPEELRLRTLDPSNGAGWLIALARADASKADAAKMTVLTALGRTERVDVYWTTLIAHLTPRSPLHKKSRRARLWWT